MTDQKKEKHDEPQKPEREKPKTNRDEQAGAPRQGPRQPRRYPDLVDDTLNDSFPASDPPSWSGR